MKKLFVAAVVGIGLLMLAGVGMFVYVSNTPPIYDSAGAVPAAEGRVSPELADAVADARARVRASIAEQNLPGLSVAVGIGDDLVWAEGFGWADLERRVPMTADTRLRIGTASKVLTAVGAGLLVERGRLDLDAEIQTYVPEFPRKPWPVSLRQLMANVAGVRDDSGDEGPFLEHCDAVVESLRLFSDGTLLFEPGTRFRESNYGWMLVSAAIERAAEEPFLRFMRRAIFEPAGMHDTKPDSGPDVRQDYTTGYATAYFPRFAADPNYGFHLTRPLDLSCYAGSAVFVSTSSDLVRFGLAIERGALLQAATRDELQTSQRLISGEETGYGLGWDLEVVTVGGREVRVAGHDGAILGGMVASLVTLPGDGLVVAVVSNASYADTFAVAVEIVNSMHGQVPRNGALD